MKLKQILAVALLVFVGLSIAYMLVKERDTSSATEKQAVAGDDGKQNQLIVYYFYGDVRCVTCRKLEAYTKEALDEYFAEEVASEDIVWRMVNVNRPENSHYVGDYELVSKAVVLSWVVNSKEVRWRKLDEIWQKVNDKQSYLQYVRESIDEFLEEGV